jgi:DNA-binding response OmpR family regulator
VRISRLRRKIEDDPMDPRIIKTVYGAGYVFSASVTWS